jgi:HAD superfamily phosphatase (TIGR01681 family)
MRWIALMVSVLAGCGNPAPTPLPSPQPAPTSNPPAAPALKMVVFDFDQTLPTIHVFHKTNGARDATKLDDAFFIEAFGGQPRIDRLRQHLKRLNDVGVRCVIVSYGFTGVIRECLKRANFSAYFADQDIYGRDSEALISLRGAKHALIAELMKSAELNFDAVLFVDDDLRNIEAAVQAKTCQTLHVTDRAGITEAHMSQLEQAAGR